MEDIAEKVRPYFSNENTGHGYWHALRVFNLGTHIAKKEDADLDIVQASCLLHDIAKETENSETCHAELGAKMCTGILQEIGFNIKKIPQVAYCILVHRYSKGVVPETLEAKIVQDSDRLEEIGAIAISRTISEDVREHKPLYDPDIPPNEKYSTGKNRTTINFLKEKSLKLTPERFHTPTARRLAVARYKFTEQFVKRFLDEWNFGNR